MVKKKKSKKSKDSKKSKKEKVPKSDILPEVAAEERLIDSGNVPTIQLAGEREIALDFATKIYKEFDQMIKSIVLFGSSAKKAATPDSDIDIIIIIDDVSIYWDAELTAWYREQLGKTIKANPYRKSLHINTVKLSTWWSDLIKGDPVVINVLRYGDSLIDHGGFFDPLKVLLKSGKIKSTPESIYTLLQRAPHHMGRARQAMLQAIDGLYWCAVDSAHAALISANVMPPSPEQIPEIMEETFVKTKMIKSKYVSYYSDIHELAKDIVHGKRVEVKGKDIDEWFVKIDNFLSEMAKLVDKMVDKRKD